LNDNKSFKEDISMKRIFPMVISLLLITLPSHASQAPVSQSQAPQSKDATEISSGVLYSSGSILSVPSHGIEFKVPDTWRAMLPRGSDLMVMETEGKVARMFITSVAGSNDQAVRQMLSRPQSLDDMTRLYPAAQVSEQDGLFSQSYSVTGLNLQKLVATAYGRLGDNNTAVFVIMLEPEKQNALPALGKKLIQSVVFSAPENAAQARAESGKNIDWERVVRGRTIEFTKNDDGHSVKKRMSLCSNGRFYFTEKESIVSKDSMSNISANTQSKESGYWQLAGSQLQLLWSDGSRTQYNLSKRRVGKGDQPGLFLNDEHWLYQRNPACH
jgi:hypothetical protein